MGTTLERTQAAVGWPTKCLQPWTIQEVETSHGEQGWKKRTRTAINHYVNSLIKYVSVILPLSPIGTPAHHIKVLMGTSDMSIQAPCLAGRLAHYVRNWEVI